MKGIAIDTDHDLEKDGIKPYEIHRIFDEYCNIVVDPYNEKLIEQ